VIDEIHASPPARLGLDRIIVPGERSQATAARRAKAFQFRRPRRALSRSAGAGRRLAGKVADPRGSAQEK
jgi:hypothetical protein